jgi:hypothetical protein
MACDSCQTNPENSTPVKIYTPKGAARAMLTGKILKSVQGWEFFWQDRGSDGTGFWFKDDEGEIFPARDFCDLYSDID